MNLYTAVAIFVKNAPQLINGILDAVEAEDLLQRTWAGRKLAGFRNIPAGDTVAVKEVLQRLAQLSWDHPEIAEIEINPLRVLTPGEGVVAVDVRVMLE